LSEKLIGLLLSFFRDYGYYLVFFGLLLENIVVIGIFFPGETLFFLAFFLSFQGHLRWDLVALLGIMGATLGNVLGYFLGKYGGREWFFHLLPRWLQGKAQQAEDYFQVHGGKTVFLARFATGVRVFIPAVAGFSRMSFGPFLFYSFSAILSWSFMMLLLAFFFGKSLPLLLKYLNWFGWLFLLIFFFAFLFWWRRRSEGKNN
jgi:membrane-associated protein